MEPVESFHLEPVEVEPVDGQQEEPKELLRVVDFLERRQVDPDHLEGEAVVV